MWLYVLSTLLVLLLASAYVALLILSPLPLPTGPHELVCRSAASPQHTTPLPSIQDPPSCALTVVIPAYNETLRLPNMLNESIPHLEAHYSRLAPRLPGDTHLTQKGYEILIVDDGSTDKTANTALAYGALHFPESEIRVVTLSPNRGKGAGVRHGVLHARGERIIFVDADGATKFEDLDKVWQECATLERENGGFGAAVGSRAHLVGTEAVVKRSFIRNVLMYGLHFLLRTLGVGHIKDTQCGFKIFSRPTAALVFPSLHVHGWMFDVEILMLLRMLRIPVAEVPVGWHEVSGSKIRLVWDSLGMLKDLVVVRANYALGRWSVPKRPNLERTAHASTNGTNGVKKE